jgi:zinc protease
MRKLSLASVLLTGVASVVHGQGVDRSRRPTVEPAPPFRIPSVVSDKLSNGLGLRIVEDHSIPVVAVRVVVGADSTLDPTGKEGLFAVTMGAMREASATLGADALAAASASIGTMITPTSFTTTTVSFGAALTILGQMLTDPGLDSAAVERRKAVQMAAARRIAQTPSSAPRHLFYRQLYGADDPYTRSLVPTEGSVRSITRGDVQRFYDQFISPRATTLVIVGDITRSAALAEARRVFGQWEPKSRSGDDGARESPTSLAPSATAIQLIDVPAQQAYVYVGVAGPRRSAEEAASAELLGAVATARLQQELRDKRPLMYSGAIGLTWRRPTQPSAFVGSAVVDPSRHAATDRGRGGRGTASEDGWPAGALRRAGFGRRATRRARSRRSVAKILQRLDGTARVDAGIGCCRGGAASHRHRSPDRGGLGRSQGDRARATRGKSRPDRDRGFGW